MSPDVEYQALKVVANKGAKKLYKAVYKLKVRDYLIAARKS